MRKGLLLGGLLTNTESWINITQIESLTLLREVLSFTGNPCKAFMMIRLGFIPERFGIIKKRLQFVLNDI